MRELASITLLGLFMLWSIRSSDVRSSIFNLIKSFFAHKILLTIVVLYICITIACYIIYLIGFWKVEYTKDTIIYSLATIPLLWKTIQYRSQQEFKQLIVNQVKWSAFISVYLNLYTFNYWLELIFQFVICFLILTIGTVERQNKIDKESKQLLGCLNTINTILYITLLIFVIYQTCTHSFTETLNILLQGIILPLILTIFIIPYLYLFTIYCTYELWFLRLNISVNNDKIEYLTRKKLLLKTCKINLNRIRYIEQHLQLFMIKNNSDFIQKVNHYKLKYEIEK